VVKVLSLLFVFALVAPSVSLACSCRLYTSVEEQFEHQFKNADAVFVGTAERVETFEDSRTLEISGFERVEFSVSMSWKGPEPGTAFHTWTETRCCVCGLSVKEGEHYLVFSYMNAEGRFSLSSCSLTGPLVAAGEILEFLEKANKRL